MCIVFKFTPAPRRRPVSSMRQCALAHSGRTASQARADARRTAHGFPMLDNLTQRMARVVKTLRGEARLTEANTQEMLREVRLALLEADVALPVVRDFI